MYSIKQKPLTMSDEQWKANITRSDRRQYLNTDYANWSMDVKSNAICKLKITYDEDLWKELYEIAQSLRYENFHKILNLAIWPECDATKRLQDILSVFENDIDKYLFFMSPPMTMDDMIYPHRDPTRGTSIYLPIGPYGIDYAPLEMYYDHDEYGLPENNSPTVWAWNTQCTHAVFNLYQPRYNIQLGMNLPYQQVFEKYNDLFDI